MPRRTELRREIYEPRVAPLSTGNNAHSTDSTINALLEGYVLALIAQRKTNKQIYDTLVAIPGVDEDFLNDHGQECLVFLAKRSEENATPRIRPEDVYTPVFPNSTFITSSNSPASWVLEEDLDP